MTIYCVSRHATEEGTSKADLRAQADADTAGVVLRHAGEASGGPKALAGRP
jgi:hypothetical protein